MLNYFSNAPLESAKHADVTLLYSARDTEHNNAIALMLYLEARHSQEGKQ